MPDYAHMTQAELVDAARRAYRVCDSAADAETCARGCAAMERLWPYLLPASYGGLHWMPATY